MKERLAALSSRVGEVEQEAETARKELIKTEEMNTKYQRDIREVRSSPHLPPVSGLLFLRYPVQTERPMNTASKSWALIKATVHRKLKIYIRNSTRNLFIKPCSWKRVCICATLIGGRPTPLCFSITGVHSGKFSAISRF